MTLTGLPARTVSPPHRHAGRCRFEGGGSNDRAARHQLSEPSLQRRSAAPTSTLLTGPPADVHVKGGGG